MNIGINTLKKISIHWYIIILLIRYLLPAYGSLAVISVVGLMNVSNRKFIQFSIRGLMTL